MRALILRIWKESTYTIGRLYVDGQFFCHVLEDADRGMRQDMPEEELRKLKKPKITAIPTGQYKVRMTFSPRFNRMMPQILLVPAYDGVRIHSGNKSEHTEGCPLLGQVDEKCIKDWISNSKVHAAAFEERLKEAGGECDLEIV